MQRIKIAVKKAIRKVTKRLPVIILIALVAGFTTLGVISAAETISNTYYNHAIAPLVADATFTK